jgi:hypothetical protein
VTPALIRGHCRGVTRSRYLRGPSRRRQSAIIRPTMWIWRLRMSCGVMSATRVQIISASCVLSKIDVESQAQRTPLPAVHCSASRYLPSGGGKSSPSVFFRDDLATFGPGTADLCSKTPNFITISVPWNLYPPPPPFLATLAAALVRRFLDRGEVLQGPCRVHVLAREGRT